MDILLTSARDKNIQPNHVRQRTRETPNRAPPQKLFEIFDTPKELRQALRKKSLE